MMLCFIPARGGSKRIPRKNARPLAGKPLLLYTVEAAQRCGVFAKIVVSSDDEEILTLARGAGVEADARPVELGGDRVRFVEVLAEYLRRAPGKYTHVAVLLPTCPFRTAEDLRAAVAKYRELPAGAFLVSVTRYEFPPEFACDFSAADGRLTLRQPEVYRRSTQSQSVGVSHHPDGGIFLVPVGRFLETESCFTEPLFAIETPPEHALDLDFPHHWSLAEAMMEAHLRQPNS